MSARVEVIPGTVVHLRVHQGEGYGGVSARVREEASVRGYIIRGHDSPRAIRSSGKKIRIKNNLKEIGLAEPRCWHGESNSKDNPLFYRNEARRTCSKEK